ncbi:heat shock 70 kDa protein 12B-like [Mercenaria mercenaria]|uniref:heat shock 70 kDa protein 12B-like n=1 Tax=Mercenaria mercenaria TaxID=6596 RepID=UPI00234F7732|nr:heat shock 70 kDa protein 12B-like [Mercenaria mercenaria]
MVAAIDFGTTYSGYAFSFRNDYERNPLKINMNFHLGSRTSIMSVKAPTAVLFDDRKQLHSFGYEAEDTYYELVAENEHRDWCFFRKFKMKLYTEKVCITFVLQHVKVIFMKLARYYGDTYQILTVPAIWTDQAKQFMREAANKAGIENGNLSIALEPEAASIYCQAIDVDRDHRFATIHAGTKYMVIDLGGGTVDITVHEKQSDGGLKELFKASGGAWGGTRVDEEFNKLIISIFGEEVFRKFCNESKEDYLDLQREFETKKKQTEKSDRKLTVRISFKLLEIYRQETRITIETSIRESKYYGKITWFGDKLRIEHDVLNGLFKPCCDNIVRHISHLLENAAVKGTSVFMMVGGFSNCQIVQNAIKRAFPSVKVIIPELAQLAVLKGAVIFGHRPLAISSRISKYTYGVSISPLFDSSIHPEFRRVVINGNDRCRDVFKKYIYAGKNVREGDARSWKLTTLWPRQKKIKLKIYESTRPNTMYVDEEGTKYIGAVDIRLPEIDELSVVNVKMMFGETELMVEVTELSRNQIFSAHFDFPRT